MNTVSVIIPACNCGPYIDDCLQSVVSQSGSFRLEILLVDDGSTDATPRIISGYQRAYPDTIKVISQQNSGQSVARNRGIDSATGDYLMFVDADDMLLPGAVGSLLHGISSTGATIACGSHVRRYPGNHRHRATSEFQIITPAEATAVLLYQTIPSLSSSLWAKMFDRRLFDNGPRLWEGHIYEDLDIMPRLFLESASVAYTSAPLYFYRNNPRSTLSTWSDRRKDMLAVTQRIAEIPEVLADTTLLRAAQDRAFSAACNCLINMHRHHDHDATTRRRCRDIIRSTAPLTLRDSRARLKNRLSALLLSLLP